MFTEVKLPVAYEFIEKKMQCNGVTVSPNKVNYILCSGTMSCHNDNLMSLFDLTFGFNSRIDLVDHVCDVSTQTAYVLAASAATPDRLPESRARNYAFLATMLWYFF